MKTETAKGYSEENPFDNILRLLMFHKIFFSPQVKRWEVTSFKHGIYHLPHELLNELRLRNLGN